MRVVVCGAGPMGRGCVARTALNSGNQVTIIDKDATLVDALNEQGRFTVKTVSINADFKETVIGFYAAVPSSSFAIESLKHASSVIMMEKFCQDIRAELHWILGVMEERFKEADEPVNVIVCGHLCAEREAIFNEIRDSVTNPNLGLARGIMCFTAGEVANTLMVVKDTGSSLLVDKSALVRPLRYNGIQLVDSFALAMDAHICLYHMTLTYAVFVGAREGYNRICEVVDDFLILRGMECAYSNAVKAISAEYKILESEIKTGECSHNKRYFERYLPYYIRDFVHYPIKFLAEENGLLRAYKLAKKHGYCVDEYLRAIAAVIYCRESDSDQAQRIQRCIHLFGLDVAIRTFTNITDIEDISKIIANYYRV